MNIYRMLHFVASRRVPASVKLLGLCMMHLVGRRTIGVFIDPVLSCNLRCRMCYFSDADKRRSMHGVMTRKRLDAVARALYSRALKLQIGCGAEPTLYGDLVGIVRQGHDYGIPYISLTTNGQLIASGNVSLIELVRAGLDEITLSIHGTSKEIYEEMMPGATFERLSSLIDCMIEAKHEFPGFKIRINYTVNSLNMYDLQDDCFWKLWRGLELDIVQLRPVQDMGRTEWSDFDMSPLKDNYDCTIGNIIKGCRERGITCIAPGREQLDEVATLQDGVSSVIEDITYCYVSPESCYSEDFNIENDTYDSYHRRRGTVGKLFKAVWSRKERMRNASKKLNYDVK